MFSSMTSCADDLADDLGDFDGQAVDLRVLQLLDRLLGELAVLLDEDLARLRVADVARRALAREQVVLDRLLVLLARARGRWSRSSRSS